MFEVNYDNNKKLVNDLDFLSKKNIKMGKVLMLVYSLLKLAVAGSLMLVFSQYGLTLISLIIASIASVGVFAVWSNVIVPYKKRLEYLNNKKVQLMVDFASKGVPTNDLELEKVATLDDRQDAVVQVLKTNEAGEIVLEDEVFGHVGNLYNYYKFLDRDGKRRLLVVIKNFYENRSRLENTEGFISVIDNKVNACVLEEADEELLSLEVVEQINASEEISKIKTKTKKKVK